MASQIENKSVGMLPLEQEAPAPIASKQERRWGRENLPTELGAGPNYEK